MPQRASPTENATGGVILAGGRARRMGGGDKCLLPLAGRPLLTYIIERARRQSAPLALNANGDKARFSAFRLPVVADTISGHAGPLAGVLAGMLWLGRVAPDRAWLATFAGDAPFVPDNLVAALHEARLAEGAAIAFAASGGRRHPVCGLWPVAHARALAQALASGVRKVEDWSGRYRVATAHWPVEPFDPFLNLNTPADIAEAERAFAFARAQPPL